MKKVGITTVYTGFNYGSSLQAYASKTFISKMGYEAELLWHKDGIVPGRDIRINKILKMLSRTWFRPTLFKKTFLTYKNSLKKEISTEVKNQFFDFQSRKINAKKLGWSELKSYANDENTLACVCGSDQIWNATNVYIDPIFYLRFAPKHKRVAYAPSFGKDIIPEYNLKKISKLVSEFEFLSVREEQGSKLINDMIDRKAEVVLDPTLLLNKEEWLKEIKSKDVVSGEFILLYFLDRPTEVAKHYINEIVNKLGLQVVVIPYKYDDFEDINNVQYVNAGPEEFINLINKAKFICTDSFHGSAFSVNFNKDFYIFKRDYGTAVDQSSRIVSLLNKLSIESRFISEVDKKDSKYKIELNINYSETNRLLNIERENSKKYIEDAFNKIEKSNK